MIPTDMKPLLHALLLKARSNEVSWVAAADLELGSDNDDVVVSLPDYSINVFRGESDEGDTILAMNILNAAGKRIAGMSAMQGDEGYTILEEILTLATRKIAGVDVAIADILQFLTQPGVVGKPKTQRSKTTEDDKLPF